LQSKRFCPSCGKTSGPFIRGICKECFLKEHKLLILPEKLELQQCRDCNKILLRGKLAEPSEAALKEFVKKHVRVKELVNETITVELQQRNDSEIEFRVMAKGFLESIPLLLERNVLVRVQPVQCDCCMRLKSNYHEAKVQLRGMKTEPAFNRLQELLKGLRKKDCLSAIVAVEKNKNGLDVLIGSRKAAATAVNQLKREFEAKVKTAFKLVGVDKKGKERKRVTFSVRV